MQELVIMAPTQIKRMLSPGNIYDWTVIDFYCKARRMQGIQITCPLLWNVNGDPILEQVNVYKGEVNSHNIETYIQETIQNLQVTLDEYGIEFDFEMRDDQIQTELKAFLDKTCRNVIREGKVKVAYCPNCDSDYGTDPGIKICKKCKTSVLFMPKKTLYIPIQRRVIADRIKEINFFPESTKKKLINFNLKMPELYNLILTRNRDYSLEYRGHTLDPRFVAMLLPALVNQGNYKKITYIHGDVVKKFDYYTLCYLNKSYLPIQIVSHGNVMNQDKRKLRWQDVSSSDSLFFDLNKSLMRAYILKHNLFSGLRIQGENLSESTKGLARLRHRINLLLQLFPGEADGIILAYEKEVMNAINRFQFAVAFEIMRKGIASIWKKAKDKKISRREYCWVENMSTLYFGRKTQ